MYLNTSTVTKCTESEIRAAFPNTSFPVPFVAPEGYAVLFASPQPAHDPITQAVRETTPVLTDKGHWEQTWEVVPRFAEYTDDEGVTHTVAEQEAAAIAADAEAKAAAAREAAKAARQTAVDNIKVTTQAGNTFDGDETSQTRMSRAILVLSTGAAASVPWVLADNTVIQADISELTEALALAGAEQARLWVL